jgi:hypothetical protein
LPPLADAVQWEFPYDPPVIFTQRPNSGASADAFAADDAHSAITTSSTTVTLVISRLPSI